jgi:ubiquinone/menaquinone biosynthesis C-methylase UbiE
LEIKITSIESKLETKKDEFRKYFLKYTRQAFQILPTIKEPLILDLGCGSGNPTIELSRLSDGKIIGIDIDQNSLDKLNGKIKKEGLSKRVFTKKCSLFNLDFPDNTFDIIWAEGSIHIIGFYNGLKELRHLLRQDGFLVIHDGVREISTKLNNISKLGYKLLNNFKIPNDAWWIYYFEPLEQLIKKYEKIKNDKIQNILESYQNEVNQYKVDPKNNVSAFYIFQKA